MAEKCFVFKDNVFYTGDEVIIELLDHSRCSGIIADIFVNNTIYLDSKEPKKGTIHSCFKNSDIRSIELIEREKIASKPDMINRPPHYKSETGLEAIDVIEAFTFDLKGSEAVCTANVLKYMCRWKKKNGFQDLKKAQWYLQRLINNIEKMEVENELTVYSDEPIVINYDKEKEN